MKGAAIGDSLSVDESDVLSEEVEGASNFDALTIPINGLFHVVHVKNDDKIALFRKNLSLSMGSLILIEGGALEKLHSLFVPVQFTNIGFLEAIPVFSCEKESFSWNSLLMLGVSKVSVVVFLKDAPKCDNDETLPESSSTKINPFLWNKNIAMTFTLLIRHDRICKDNIWNLVSCFT